MLNSSYQAGILALYAKKAQGISVSAALMLFASGATRMLRLHGFEEIKGFAMIALSLHYLEKKAWMLIQMGYGTLIVLNFYHILLFNGSF